MAATPRISLICRRGDTWAFPVRFNAPGATEDTVGDPIDVSGREFLAQMRRTQDDADTLAEFTIDTSEATDGVIWLTVDAETMANVTPGSAWVDLQETVAGNVNTLWEAKVKVEKDVSR